VRSPLYRLFLAIVWIASLAVVGWLAWTGSDYYQTSLAERPRHEAYWELKPGGTQGHAMGIVGSSMMVVMLVYSLRKRFAPLRRLGKLRIWLDFHIYCGVIGPLLVVLHSSFKVQGLVSLSFWSMVAVASSGVLGRYLYLQIPRSRAGDELSLGEAERAGRELTERLRADFGLDEAGVERLDAMAADHVRPRAGVLTTFLLLPWDGLRLRLGVRRFVRNLPGVSGAERRGLLKTLRQRALLQRRLLIWERLQQLFHYWHVFHKPFAVVMYLFMVVHIVVAMATGYGWGVGG
jgi:hypothetical protein